MPSREPSPQKDSADTALNPTLPEGSYWELLQNLWRTGLETGSEWSASPVTDVAFFTQGFVRAWYFTARDGTLRKKRMKSLGVSELAAAFSKGESSGHEEDVVAYAVFGPNGVMDAAGRAGSSVAPLERASLRWLLDQRDSSRRKRLQAILKYVRPRGERESVLRFDWRAQVCSFELRSSVFPLKAASSASAVPPYNRLSTHGPALVHSQKEKHVTAAAVREASAICERLAQRILPHVARDRARVCADFKLLGGDRVQLMWASTPPPDATYPSTDFPASMPCATLPSEAAGERPASHVEDHLLVPQPSSRRRAAAGGGAALSARPSLSHGINNTNQGVAPPPLLLDSFRRPPGADADADEPDPADPAAASGRRGGGGGGRARVPGAGLMCSRYFICKGCGRTELRTSRCSPSATSSPRRPPASYVSRRCAPSRRRRRERARRRRRRAAAAAAGTAAADRRRAARWAAPPPRVRRPRPTSARTLSPLRASRRRGSSCARQTASTSPPCARLRARALEAAQAEEERQQTLRGAASSSGKGGAAGGSPSASPPRAASRYSLSPPRTRSPTLGTERLQQQEEPPPPPGDAAGDAHAATDGDHDPTPAPPRPPAVAEYLRAQSTPRWLREYLQ